MEQTTKLRRVDCTKCNAYLELKPVKNEVDEAVMYCYHCDIYIHIVADFSQASGVTLHLLASPAGERPTLTTDRYAPVPIREIPQDAPQIPDLNDAIPDLNDATPEVNIEVPPLSDEARDEAPEVSEEASPPPRNSEGSESIILSEYMTLIRECFTVAPDQTVTTAEMVATCKSRRETFSHATLHKAKEALQTAGEIRKVKRGVYQLC